MPTVTSPIVIISPLAAAHIKKLMKQSPGCKGFRLSVKKGGCTGFSYLPKLVETTDENDLHWLHEAGFSVFIDPQAADMLKGTLLDLDVKEMGQSQLIYQNPNVKKTCGCGISFNIEDTEES